MLKFALSGAVTAIFLSATVAPAWAQAANAEPGYCAQFYPNADCNSVGPEIPGSKKTQDEAAEDTAIEPAPVSPPVKPAKPRKQAHSSAVGTKTPKAAAVAK